MAFTCKNSVWSLFLILVVLPAISAAAAVKVSVVQPKIVSLQAGKSTTVILRGNHLNQALGSVVYQQRSQRTVPGVTARLKKGNNSVRKLKLSAGKKTRPGTYRVLLMIRGGQVAVPMRFSVTPVAKSTKAAKPPGKTVSVSTSSVQRATKLSAPLTAQKKKPVVTNYASPSTPLSTRDALINQSVDLGGGPSSSQSFVTIYNFRINGGAGTTEDRNVVLTHSATNNPTHYRVSESSDWAQASWIPYETNPTYILSQSTGVKTIYLQIKGQDTQSRLGNPQPNLASTTDTIEYYSEPLVVTNFRAANGFNEILNRRVLLTWNISGAAASHRVSESANMAGVVWQNGGSPPAGGFALELAEGSTGPRTLYLQVRRDAGNPMTLSYDINLKVGVCPIGHRGLECSGAGTCTDSGQCACNPDNSGDECRTICQRCYGAAGNNCGVADGPNVLSDNTGACYYGLGGSTCKINAGSWAHDECCVRYRIGGPNEAQGSCTYPGLGPPPYFCQDLMDKAVQHLSAPSLTWTRQGVNFNKSSCTSGSEMPVNHADMCNPSGGTLLCTDKQYCCSKSGRPQFPQPPSALTFGQVCVCD